MPSILNSTSKFHMGSLLIFATWSLCSCALPKPTPTSDYVRVDTGFSISEQKFQKVALLLDSCVLMDAIAADDYYSATESRSASNALSQGAVQYLLTKGYTVTATLRPATCGFLPPSSSSLVLKEQNTAAEQMPPPFDRDGSIEPNSLDTILRLERAVFSAVGQSVKQPAEALGSLPEADLKVLRNLAKSDLLIIALERGIVVPGAKSFGQGFATGMITGILTLGLVSVTHYEVSATDSYVGAIDLESGRLVWANSLRHKMAPNDQRFLTNDWAHSLLFHLPSPAKTS